MPQIARILNSGMLGDDGSYGLKSGNFFAASISSRAFFMLFRLCASALDASASVISRMAASLSMFDSHPILLHDARALSMGMARPGDGSGPSPPATAGLAKNSLNMFSLLDLQARAMRRSGVAHSITSSARASNVGFSLPLRPLARMGQDQKSGSTCGQARSRKKIGRDDGLCLWKASQHRQPTP